MRVKDLEVDTVETIRVITTTTHRENTEWENVFALNVFE